jgi:hypothetical protein
MAKPRIWLASPGSDGINGKRVIATRWLDEQTATADAIEDARWAPQPEMCSCAAQRPLRRRVMAAP